MYTIKNVSTCGNLLDLDKLSNLISFSMGSKNKVFNINGVGISNINICSKNLGHPLVSKKVFAHYNSLIRVLTELLIDNSDDESGDNYREALNQIERFRRMIKNKYRDFLIQEEIELMSKQLIVLQKEAKTRLFEIQENYNNLYNNHRSR